MENEKEEKPRSPSKGDEKSKESGKNPKEPPTGYKLGRSISLSRSGSKNSPARKSPSPKPKFP